MESPGTAKRIAQTLAQGGRERDDTLNALGVDRFEIEATGGYILVPPENISPLALSWKEDGSIQETRGLRNEERWTRLIHRVQNSDALWIGTDPDEEGEGIASDVWCLIREAHVLPERVYRVRLYALDATSIHTSLRQQEEIPHNTEWNSARPSGFRRIVDRWIAGALGSPSAPVGRVSSGFLHAAFRNPSPPSPDPPKTEETPIGPHLGDILLAPELSDIPLSEIQNRLQWLYETGQASYPRTDSRSCSARHEHSHTALQVLGRTRQEEIADLSLMEPPRLPKDTRILCAIHRRSRTLGWQDGEYLGQRWRRQWKDSFRDSSFWRNRIQERAVLRVLLSNGLGRPSTWASFSTKHTDALEPVANTERPEFRLSGSGQRQYRYQPRDLGLEFQGSFRRLLDGLPERNDPPSVWVRETLNLLPESSRLLKVAMDAGTVNQMAPVQTFTESPKESFSSLSF